MAGWPGEHPPGPQPSEEAWDRTECRCETISLEPSGSATHQRRLNDASAMAPRRLNDASVPANPEIRLASVTTNNQRPSLPLGGKLPSLRPYAGKGSNEGPPTLPCATMEAETTCGDARFRQGVALLRLQAEVPSPSLIRRQNSSWQQATSSCSLTRAARPPPHPISEVDGGRNNSGVAALQRRCERLRKIGLGRGGSAGRDAPADT